MKQKFFLSLIMTFALELPIYAQAEKNQTPAPSNPHEGIDNILSLPSSYEESEIRDGISHAVPVDLFDVDNKLMQLPSYANGRQDAETSESCRKLKNSAVNLIGFKAVTDDYGQLRSILEANKGTEIDSLVVVGPMNKDDFTAIWDCAVYGNMQVLILA
ncbi:MAG: hypothetical protein K2J86_03510 [Prevotella sp.]|nr:hypothetical protein [Prevotella sp.]